MEPIGLDAVSLALGQYYLFVRGATLAILDEWSKKEDGTTAVAKRHSK